MRIGHGFDAHRFQTGGKLILGGVVIDYEFGMQAHSDGDVLIHALCDAMLGALSLGDLGQHFPDTDERYANCDSRVFLRQIAEQCQERQYRLLNLDATLIAQSPKLSPYILEMRENLAVELEVNLDQVSVKATTTEHMGFVGRNEGIAAMAVVLLETI